MKKILHKFLPLLFLVSLTSCKQLVDSVEETFSYWTDSAKIIGIEIPSGVPVDGDGFSSLPSGKDAHIYFNLHNSQKFEFLMPNDPDAPADIIIFDENVKGKSGGRPEFGEDYSLAQKAFDKLELTYTKEFLLKNEQGKADLNPKINLYNKNDKRKFDQNYSYKLRANTPPPQLQWFTTGKIQQGSDWYYVLIFKFEGLNYSIDTENLLHGDISEVYLTEGESQKPSITVKLTKNGFDVSESMGQLLSPAESITALQTQDVAGGNLSLFESIPNANDRKWMLCIKTGVKAGQSLNYGLKLKDSKSLYSPETIGKTDSAKLSIPQISYDSGMNTLTSSGVYTDNETDLSIGTSTNPIHISSCFGNAVVLKAHNTAYPSDVTIEAEVKLSDSTPAPSGFTGPKGRIQKSGGITKILLDPIPGVDEIYEVKLKASGPNYTDSDEKTYYYQIKKEVRTGDSSWQILKKAVNLASAGDTIYINGHIISTSAANNSGEIEVREDINIQGLNGKAVDIIDANKDGTNKPGTLHRIFTIKSGKSLNLTGLTLQNGKADIGGAVISENGSVLTLSNTDIKNSEASIGGGAISTGGTLIINNDSVISGNRANQGGAVYNNGTFKISGSAKITIDPTKNDVYLPAEKVITVTGSLTETSVARISPENYPSVGNPTITVLTAAPGVILADQVSKFKVTDDTDGKKWKINAAGKLELANKTITVTSWKELKKAVKEGKYNTILVNSNLTAAYGTDEENYGTIEITKNMTIKGNNPSSRNIMELNLDTFISSGISKKHKIFKIKNDAVVRLENLELKNGYSTDSGGGIEILSGGVTLSGITIDNCTAKSNGGGIVVLGGSLKIENGSLIQNCKALKDTGSSTTAHGGGIFVGSSGTLELSGVKIYKNEAKNYGGGIYTKGNTKIVSAIIDENSSTLRGGGIYLAGGTLNMSGGEIKKNTAGQGGGCYFENGTFNISEVAKITPSTDGDEHTHGRNDVYLSDGKKIKITGSLTAGPNQAARITVPNSKYNVSTQVLTGDTSTNANKFKVTKKGSEEWEVKSDGYLKKKN